MSFMAAVYAVLLCLTRSLHQILNLQQYINPSHREKLFSLLEKVSFIVTFLEDYSEKHPGTLDLVENGMIRKAAYEAQDFMDSYLTWVSRTAYADSSSSNNFLIDLYKDELTIGQDLNMALERINFIQEEMMKMKNNDPVKDLRSRTYSSPTDHSSTLKITGKSNIFVGFDDDLNAINERLHDGSVKLQIIPIVGMGGIGKTTLARKAYEDSLLTKHFDIRSWITVSQEYDRGDILSRLLQSLGKPVTDESESRLAELVHKNLLGRRYLIVIDDMWSSKSWDDLKMIFPDDGTGSRILLTTRLTDIAVYAGSWNTPFHQMSFLNNDQSWKLLQAKIFGQESCPLQLVEIGKRIAKKCGGLPLTIVVVAGLLQMSSGNKMGQELWENVLNKISSTEPTIALQCSKILCLSYDRLPLRLKPCFLYMAAFPEDSIIDVSELIKLWMAEGFLKPSDPFQCLEDVGERNLEDLVNRSLILASTKEQDGKIKSIIIHDLLRDICVAKAEEERFLHRVSSKTNAHKDVAHNPNRRISIHFTKSFKEWQIQDSTAYSVLFFSGRNLGSRLYLSCSRLSVLDAPGVTLPNLSELISKLVNLRYIAFSMNLVSCPYGFPASITKLPHLQTIIAYVSSFAPLEIPYEILEMPKLRHLIIDTPFHLSNPSSIRTVLHESEIRTLHTVIDFRFNENTNKIFVNLKKLKLFFVEYRHLGDDFNLKYLFLLQNLDELQVLFYARSPLVKWNYTFPIGLKKLSLRRVPLPWKDMTIIGSLPNLEVLEMMYIEDDEDSEWTPIEGQFLRLKYFYSSLDYLVKWEVEKEHFPRLESLILWRARWIDEIPCGIGEIDSLNLIELQHCRRSLVSSAKRIQEQQRENGNDVFQVRLIDCEE